MSWYRPFMRVASFLLVPCLVVACTPAPKSAPTVSKAVAVTIEAPPPAPDEEQEPAGKPTATAAVVEHLKLPRATPGSDAASVVASPLGVMVRQQGDVSIDGRVVADLVALEAAAKARVAKEPDAQAIIMVDPQVPYGRVVEVIDALKRAGVSRIAFGVLTPPTGSGAPAPAPMP